MSKDDHSQFENSPNFDDEATSKLNQLHDPAKNREEDHITPEMKTKGYWLFFILGKSSLFVN